MQHMAGTVWPAWMWIPLVELVAALPVAPRGAGSMHKQMHGSSLNSAPCVAGASRAGGARSTFLEALLPPLHFLLLFDSAHPPARPRSLAQLSTRPRALPAWPNCPGSPAEPRRHPIACLQAASRARRSVDPHTAAVGPDSDSDVTLRHHDEHQHW